MNKLARKRADFQKLRGTTKRINRLIKSVGKHSPERVPELLKVELNIIEIKLNTVQTGIVKEMLLKFQEILKRLYSEAKNA